jgi:type IV secretory pathway TrbD component
MDTSIAEVIAFSFVVIAIAVWLGLFGLLAWYLAGLVRRWQHGRAERNDQARLRKIKSRVVFH